MCCARNQFAKALSTFTVTRLYLILFSLYLHSLSFFKCPHLCYGPVWKGHSLPLLFPFTEANLRLRGARRAPKASRFLSLPGERDVFDVHRHWGRWFKLNLEGQGLPGNWKQPFGLMKGLCCKDLDKNEAGINILLKCLYFGHKMYVHLMYLCIYNSIHNVNTVSNVDLICGVWITK